MNVVEQSIMPSIAIMVVSVALHHPKNATLILTVNKHSSLFPPGPKKFYDINDWNKFKKLQDV
jgi:hypothetical protein